jgi:flagellar motor switch/type III secretory pathway protein FliN
MATALAAPKPMPTDISESKWQEASWLACRLRAEIAVRGFIVGDLLSLEVGSVVDTGVPSDAEVSLRVNGARIGSGKLDATEEHFGVRVTELA